MRDQLSKKSIVKAINATRDFILESNEVVREPGILNLRWFIDKSFSNLDLFKEYLGFFMRDACNTQISKKIDNEIVTKSRMIEKIFHSYLFFLRSVKLADMVFNEIDLNGKKFDEALNLVMGSLERFERVALSRHVASIVKSYQNGLNVEFSFKGKGNKFTLV